VDYQALMETSDPYLRHVAEWESSLPALPLAQAMPDPARAAIVSVDVINGFCHTGPLSSPRIQRIIAPIVVLFERGYAAGLRHFVLLQDTHEPDAIEFAQYPPHCVRGSDESQSVPEFKALPFYEQMTVIPKNSIHPALNTSFESWLAANPAVDTFICVGDCTDLCTHQLAMHLRLRANAYQLKQRVILPANTADTFDTPVETALQIGAVPHAADLLHHIFLHNMHLNGVEIVREIA